MTRSPKSFGKAIEQVTEYLTCEKKKGVTFEWW